MGNLLKLLLIAMALLNFPSAAAAQTPTDSIGQLNFMLGEWQGKGWILGRDKQKRFFFQSETIQSKVNNRALMIDGLGYRIDSVGTVTDEVIHEAFGVISYNTERAAITMLAFSKLRGRMEADFTILEGKKVHWSFEEANGAVIRFTDDFSVPDQWKEVGEVSVNGKDWYPFFEMVLYRKKT
ncbi:MAG: hypothetical protein AAFZ63_25060 [Bacteroidota bacterium]